MPFKVALLVGAVLAGTLAFSSPAHAVGGEGETWPTFTESSGCGAQRMSPPHAAETGWLSKGDLLRGEAAAYFGRSVRQVQEDLVLWSVPGSSENLAVHPTVIPALKAAGAAIQARLDQGDSYKITPASTFSAAARTIGGQVRTSRHTFGTAMDFNATRNPHRHDNVLITDMPDWWVDAFLDAGFCWGGLWIGSKDTMHFAWQGPAFTDGATLPLPYAPVTDPAPLGAVDASIFVAPNPLPDTIATVLADGDGNGAIDVIRLSADGDDIIVDTSVASRRHNACSARRSVAPAFAATAESSHTLGFGDWDGRGGQDLWAITEDDGHVRLTVRWALGGYTGETATTTAVPMPDANTWVTTADVDADGDLDLVTIDADTIRGWDVDPSSGATSQLFVRDNPVPDADMYLLGDHDLDNLPDLWTISDGVVAVSSAASEWTAVESRQVPAQLPGSVLDAVIADYDGDGRRDLITFDGWSKRVWLGNTRLPDGLPLAMWFEHPEPECEEGESTWDRQELRFSTSGWVAEGSYDWRTRNGFAAGCDPEAEGCTRPTVTGRAFAEFLAWIDGLDAVGSDDTVAAARSLRLSGYATPCALSDEACWSRPMLRSDVSAQFAIFLSQRRGDVPAPHRWVLSAPLRSDQTFEPL
ncbi:MAG: M15 family metallopeptidase [Acidimicrobiia bacterium]